jgi:hypothetical protein
MVKNASKQGFSLAKRVLPFDTPLKLLVEKGVPVSAWTKNNLP